MPRKAAERAIALGDDDPFDWSLAAELRQSKRWVEELPNDEYVGWRAFMTWRAVQRRHAADVADMRANRR